MPFVPQPFGPEETLASLDETTPIAGLERREAERAITEWEEERRRLGRELALMTLNTSDMMGKKWSHRFIIAVGPTVEYSSFLFYGAKFAALMGLPDKHYPHGPTATGEIRAGVHQGLHQRYAAL